jgi:hypothetical protein
MNSSISLLLGVRDSGADCGLGSHTCFGEGIVTRVKIFAILRYKSDQWPNSKQAKKKYLLDFGEYVLVGWELAIEAEEFLLLLSHGLLIIDASIGLYRSRQQSITYAHVDLLALGGQHRKIFKLERTKVGSGRRQA